MLDLSHFFVASAWAQSTVPAVTGATADAPVNPLMQYAPYILILLVMYLFLIRPQQKKIDEQNKMIKALRRGDRVITAGGIFGKISRMEGDDVVFLEVADGINIKVLRSQIGGLEAKTDPVAPANDGIETEKK